MIEQEYTDTDEDLLTFEELRNNLGGHIFMTSLEKKTPFGKRFQGARQRIGNWATFKAHGVEGLDSLGDGSLIEADLIYDDEPEPVEPIDA